MSIFDKVYASPSWLYAKLKLQIQPCEYILTRFLFLRALAFVYLMAYLGLAFQARALFGEKGILPAPLFINRVISFYGEPLETFFKIPSLFLWHFSDFSLSFFVWLGVGLSILALIGVTNSILYFALWFIYLSFVNIGQVFYGYGWESLLLETGFLAIFLCPTFAIHPFSKKTPPPIPVIWLLRWVLFRVILGAGLIKVRGDTCWLDLTCMNFHYETQPVPNPLSWYLHKIPQFLHKFEVAFTHFIELIAIWFIFGPRRLRLIAGFLQAVFQFTLIISGNLSWLNYITLVLCISCFDDAFLLRLAPARLVLGKLKSYLDSIYPLLTVTRVHRLVLTSLTALVLILSIQPVLNLFSSHQYMNASFDSFHLVNTYGAFGSITKERMEVVLEGTNETEIKPNTQWIEYGFKCKPGDLYRMPCLMSPYHYRMDWQMWFAAMSSYHDHPWIISFVSKLLKNDKDTLGLIAKNPFPNSPPRFIRAEWYYYQFTSFEERKTTGAYWKRTRMQSYLPPLWLEHPSLQAFLKKQGWE